MSASYAIAVGRFYEDLAERLIAGAMEAFSEGGVEVIRGETDHYDYVCAEAARGIMDVQLRTGVPCAFGVLTVENMDQALARSGGGKRDQGRHSAEAVMRMAAMRAALASG